MENSPQKRKKTSSAKQAKKKPSSGSGKKKPSTVTPLPEAKKSNGAAANVPSDADTVLKALIAATEAISRSSHEPHKGTATAASLQKPDAPAGDAGPSKTENVQAPLQAVKATAQTAAGVAANVAGGKAKPTIPQPAASPQPSPPSPGSGGVPL